MAAEHDLKTESPQANIRLRIHHFMCVHGFKGKGYSPDYVKNFWKIFETLKENEKTEVRAVAGADSICAPCPNNAAGECKPLGISDEKRIQGLDEAYSKTLQISPNDKLTWAEVKKRIADKVSDADFEKNCQPCSWKKLGYCREALVKIRQSALLCAIVLMGVLVQFEFAVAAPEEKPNDEFFPIEKVEAKLAADKSKKNLVFTRITKSLEQKKFAQALKETSGLEANEEFKDYYHYLTGQILLQIIEQDVEKNNWSHVVKNGERAIQALQMVPVVNAYTSLTKRANMFQGLVELRLASAYMRAKKALKARPLFESAFQRLSDRGLLVLSFSDSIKRYAELCEKKPDELCTSWENKLAAVIPKAERAKLFPRLGSLGLPSVDKVISIPYKTDKDMERFQEGFNEYLAGNFEKSYEIWNALLTEFPRTSIRLRTKFWMGRAAQKSQQDARAETLYREVIREIPFSFYAMMASWYSNIDVFRNIDAQIPMASKEAKLLTPADYIHIRKAETLIANHALALARLELREVKPQNSMTNEFLVYLATLNDVAKNHIVSFQYISELGSRGYTGFYSSFGERMIFPDHYLSLVEKPAKTYSLDPFIVLSLMKQESAFNPEVISSSNALGLMQIIPPTARDLDPGIETVELFDQEKNVTLGAKYIRQLLKRYDGDIIYTLAGYNAGPGNADRWKNEANNKVGLLPEEKIELISFRETHDYVQNILRNYYWYKRRTTGEGHVNFAQLLDSFK